MPLEKHIEEAVSGPVRKTIRDEFRRLVDEREKQSVQGPVTRRQELFGQLANELNRSSRSEHVTGSRERIRQVRDKLAKLADLILQPEPVTWLRERMQEQLLQEAIELLQGKSQHHYSPYKQKYISQGQLMDILKKEAARFIRGEAMPQSTVGQVERGQNVVESSIPRNLPLPAIVFSDASDSSETAEQAIERRMAELDQGDIEDNKYQITEEEDIDNLQIPKDFYSGEPVIHVTDNKEDIVSGRGYERFKSYQEEDLEVAKYPEEYELNSKLQYKFTKDNFIRLLYGSDLSNCNCHGFTFTNGEGGYLSTNDVKKILKDNFESILVGRFDTKLKGPRFRKGDIVIWRSQGGIIQHSGVISHVSKGKVYVISKLGKYGLYKHRIFALPPNYGVKTVEVYRAKGGHGRLLKKKPNSLKGKVEQHCIFL